MQRVLLHDAKKLCRKPGTHKGYHYMSLPSGYVVGTRSTYRQILKGVGLCMLCLVLISVRRALKWRCLQQMMGARSPQPLSIILFCILRLAGLSRTRKIG